MMAGIAPTKRLSLDTDTIAACATPLARAAIAVLRLSGPDARRITESLCPDGPAWQPRRASLRRARVEERVIDDLLVTWMPGPRSYTGEDVVELSAHGNPVIVEQLLDAVVALGARLARPGEFTRRALINGRMDLLQAESLAGLIEAKSMDGVHIARAGMSGTLSQEVQSIRESALDLAAEMEARLDHPGEDLGEVADERLAADLRSLAERALRHADTWRAGKLALQGARVSLEGRVNAGKSSLFNHLVGSARALVSPQAGTTRDVVEAGSVLNGIELTWMDTAGLRENPEPVEAAGLALAESLTRDVDLHLVLIPLHLPMDPFDREILNRTADASRLLVGTHSDLPLHSDAPVVDHKVDNLTGAGVEDLKSAIRVVLSEESAIGSAAVLTSQRQHSLLRKVAKHLKDSATALLGPWGPAVAAEEIVRGIESLGELGGTDAREAVLDRLFARFCIGK